MTYSTSNPWTAAYIVIIKDGKIPLLLRANTAWMNGYLSLPAGKVEVGETATAAAVREAKEEIGIEIVPENLKLALTMQRHDARNKHLEWVDFFFTCNAWEGDIVNAEPDVHSELVWANVDNLPKNIIPNVRAALEAIADGKTYLEFGYND